MRSRPAQSYDPSQIDTVMRPWIDAGRRHSALAFNVPMVRLRASSLVYDGAVLDGVRDETVRELHRIVTRPADTAAPQRPPQRNAILRSWWRGRIAAILPQLEDLDAEVSYADTEALLTSEPELLDTLERELIDAARFTSAVV
jgi:hypothetical protein